METESINLCSLSFFSFLILKIGWMSNVRSFLRNGYEKLHQHCLYNLHETTASISFNLSDIPLKIYVYDLPPKFNDDILNKTKYKFPDCGDVSENGYGCILKKYDGFFVQNTWQFALEVIIHNKILHSPHITKDYKNANLFYVPFYSGISCLTTMTNNYTEASIIQQKLLAELQGYLENHESKAFYSGIPHAMALSKIEREQSHVACPIMTMEGFRHVYFLGIEREAQQRSRSGPIHPLTVVPYPSSGHLLDNVTSSQYLNNIIRTDRNITMFFAGGRRNTGQPRAAIQVEFRDHQTSSSFKEFILASEMYEGITKAWLITDECFTDPVHIQEWMQHSLFCLQPPGDSPTRKSFFDSVVAGCIPVLFQSEEKVFYPFEKYLNYRSFTVTLNQSDLLIQNKTVEELLAPLLTNKNPIVEKQRQLQRVARYLQYSVLGQTQSESHDAMIFVYEEMRNILKKQSK